MQTIHRSLSGSAQRDKKCEPNTTVHFAPRAYLAPYCNGLRRIGVHGAKGTDAGSISMMDIHLYLICGVFINPLLKLFEATVTLIACFAAGHRNIRQHDFTSSMLNSEDWCGQQWGLHLEFVGNTRGRKFYMNGMLECSRSSNTLGADCAVSSLETGGLHCKPSTQSLGKTSIRMATASGEGGQETKHMGHKD